MFLEKLGGMLPSIVDVVVLLAVFLLQSSAQV